MMTRPTGRFGMRKLTARVGQRTEGRAGDGDSRILERKTRQAVGDHPGDGSAGGCATLCEQTGRIDGPADRDGERRDSGETAETPSLPDCQSTRGEQTPPWIGRDIVPPSTASSSRLGPTIKRLVTRGSDRPSLLTGPDAVDPDSMSGGSRTVDG